MRMTRRRWVSRSAIASLIAIGLVLTTTLPATASWAARVKLSGAGRAYADQGAMASAGNTIAVVYAERGENFLSHVYVRRSTDGGTTWRAPVRLSSRTADAQMPTITGLRVFFDVAWVEQDSNGDYRLKYARSVNSGANWGMRQTLSPEGEGAFEPRIARGWGDVVGVTWVSQDLGEPSKVQARVSINGGATFRSRKTLSEVGPESKPNIAIGNNGKLHVAYTDNAGPVFYQKSGNLGVSWSAPVLIEDQVQQFWAPGLAASGPTVMIGYARQAASGDIWVVYRRSNNGGTSWGSAKALSPRDGTDSLMVVLSVDGDEWRAAYARCSTDPCSDEAIVARVRTSTNAGDSWTPSQRVSPTIHSRAIPVGVHGNARPVVAWTRWEGGTFVGVYARRES